ncbi:general negative regulator of transcription subunit 5 [Ascosphaera acerosa]|nr:general negative regulator of transcription subunit 5 [Ascosphaera acerosa]
MASRKTQQEIEKTFKKVGEGIASFEGIYEKIKTTTNLTQRDKLEDQLKREIKKLQRFRDQIKTWAAGNEVKDKGPLLEQRRAIETGAQCMEQFKAVEKEMKTKAYSKEGLSAAARQDPKDKEKAEMCDFLSQTVDTLQQKVEAMEAEEETIHASMKKGKRDPAKMSRLADISRISERHRWHVGRLELLLRMLQNGNVETAQIASIKDSISYFAEDGHNPDFYGEDESIYEDLNLDEEEAAFGMSIDNDRGSSQDTQSSQGMDDDSRGGAATSGSSAGTPAPGLPSTRHGKKDTHSHISRRPSAQTQAQAQSTKSPLPVLSTIHTTSATNPSMAPAVAAAAGGTPTSTPAPKPVSLPIRAGETLKYASAAAAAAASDKSGVGIAPLPPPPGAAAAHPTPPAQPHPHPHPHPHSHSQPQAQAPSQPPAPSQPQLQSTGTTRAATAHAPTPGASTSDSTTQAPTAPTITPSATTIPPSAMKTPSSLPVPPPGLPAAPAQQAAAQPAAAEHPKEKQADKAPLSHSDAAAAATAVAAASSASTRKAAAAAAKEESAAPAPSGADKERERRETPAAMAATPVTPVTAPSAVAAPAMAASGPPAVPEAAKEEEEPIYHIPPTLQDLVQSYETAKSRFAKEWQLLDDDETLTGAAARDCPASATAGQQQQPGAGTGADPSPAAAQAQAATATGTPASVPATTAGATVSPFQRLFNASHQTCPEYLDSEKPLHYRPTFPYDTPAHYPQEPLALFRDARLYEGRLETDTLFYIFYYQQDTYYQYLAAKALKSQSWRFHKQYQTWFQRHEEPKVITEEFEQGTYRFFDYESTWMNRRKADFQFMYKYLEDEL